MPSDINKAVDNIPSISVTFRKMLEEMKKYKSKYLIIDLRDNGGGWTPIVSSTLYQLYGDKYLEKNMNARFYRIVSPLYLKKLGISLEEFNRNNHLNGRPVYSPQRVFVITNENTFSAAFHYAFYLWKMGATVVGVPSSQAPNAFMETTEFTLPYTGLKGSISCSMQLFLPAGDKRAKVFYPDVMLSWDDYRRFGFDKYADLRCLLEGLGLTYSESMR